MDDIILKMCIVCKRANHVFNHLVETGNEDELKDSPGAMVVNGKRSSGVCCG